MKCPKCFTDNPETKKFCGECGTQLSFSDEVEASPTKTIETPIEELTTGSTFADRYQIIEELGKGGMGKVYKVFDREISEKIALKLIKPEIASDKSTIERFRNELKIARKIGHQNVCRMYDLNKENNNSFITMEYISGGDLKRFIRRSKQLTVGTAISIAKQICEGLAAAHNLGIVHRDLKPNNIMIDDDGNVHIMDFGIARSTKGKGITGSGVMIGTPEYMSPEQAEAKEVDYRSDIYSLGVIIFEMLTGQLPFEGDSPLSIAMKHKGEAPPDPKELNPLVPDELSQLILKCMKKIKEDRYQSAEDVLGDLDKIEKGVPTTQKEIPRKKPLTSKEVTVTLSTKKLFFPGLAIVVLACIVLILWQPWKKTDLAPIATDKPSLAILYFENNSGDQTLDNWRDGIADLLITDLQQSRFLTVLSRENIYSVLKNLDLLAVEKFSMDDLSQVAEEGRVNHILNGSFMTAGDKFIINYSLINAQSGEVIRSLREEGIGEGSITSSVDRITKAVKSELRFTQEQMAVDIDRDAKTITTSSPEAFKYYIEGRKLNNKGEWRKGIEAFEKAVEIDPEFATAYRALSASLYNLGYSTEAKENSAKAFEFAHRVSDRERYRIEAEHFFETENTWDKCIEAFQNLLESYPDERSARNNLGIVYFSLEDWDKALDLYEIDIRNKDETFYAYWWKSIIKMCLGLYEEGIEVIEYFNTNFEPHLYMNLNLATIYLIEEKYDLALHEVDKILVNTPSSWDAISLRRDILHCREDFSQAEVESRKLLEHEEDMAKLDGYEGLGALYFLRGKSKDAIDMLVRGKELAGKIGERGEDAEVRLFLAYVLAQDKNIEAALDECEMVFNRSQETESITGQIAALFTKGWIYLQREDIDSAKSSAEELKVLVDSWMNRKLIRRYYLLSGLVDLREEKYQEAVNNIGMAMDLMPSQTWWPSGQAFYVGSLAEAYYKAGELQKSQEQYTKITALTTGRLHYGDIYAKSFYMLGKIYEEMGNTANAIKNYEKFLDLWKDAGPGIPEVDYAKNQLAQLKGDIRP